MKLAIEEHRQYLDWADGKTNGAARGKTVREEKRPDWMKEETGKKQEQPALSAQDLENRRKNDGRNEKLKKYSAY